ncbi:MAG: single-stranded-DNA-specific exonuclease RecJ [Bacteroidota bacterium]
MIPKRWKIKNPGNPNVIELLQKELNVSSVIANILSHRGITSFEEARKFFRPQLSDLHNPFLMKDMDKAVARIEQAIKNKEKILVYGDYDVDGTTAVAMMYDFLKKIYSPFLKEDELVSNGLVDFYIPDRYKEGYGISFAGIDFAADNNFSLFIALDCGIKGVGEIDYAKKKGIDFIICDHHIPGEKIPDAIAVLDPKRSDCNYPYKELSGCGIGFKLIQAFSQVHQDFAFLLEQYLDLVVTSIASDIVPITGENRILAYFGLQRINNNPREGFRAILELNNIKKEFTITDLVFVIGPRINAAGRMDSGKKAVELLITSSKEQAMELAVYLNQINMNRKETDSSITQQAIKMIASNPELQNKKTTVLFDPQWHKGVIGIVASRLIETYYRPTIILTEFNGIISGSARSVKGFNIYEAIVACSDLLDHFGGHRYAAGLSLKPENIKKFISRFEEVVSSTIDEELLIPEIEIDDVINFSDITSNFYNILKQFAPFGPKNMNPVFLTKNVVDKGYVRIVGSNHLKMNVFQTANSLSDKRITNTKTIGTSKPQTIPAIAFDMGGHYFNVYKKTPFKVCYNISKQEWEGNSFLQLNVKDMKW